MSDDCCDERARSSGEAPQPLVPWEKTQLTQDVAAHRQFRTGMLLSYQGLASREPLAEQIDNG